MPKKPTAKENLMAYFDNLNKDGKKNAYAYKVGQGSTVAKVERWSTGIEDLDYILGGGMPKGRIVEIFGAESSGKTTLLYHLLAQHELAVDIPVEGTFDEARAAAFGNTPNNLTIVQSKYGEEAMAVMYNAAKLGATIIGLDSIPHLRPKEVVDKIEKSARTMKVEETRIGPIARLMNNWLPVLQETIEQTGTTLIFVNQQRAKTDAMAFGSKTTTPGGQALRYSYSVRLKVAKDLNGFITIPNKDPRSTNENEIIGMKMVIKVEKNKVGSPGGMCKVAFIHDVGFVSWDAIEPIRKAKMEANRKCLKEMAKANKEAQEGIEEGWDD